MSDAAIANIGTSLVMVTTIIIGFLTLWVKLRYGANKAEEAAANASRVEVKLDQNTAMTKAGAAAAVNSSKEAKTAANKASELALQLNGALDVRIRSIVEQTFAPLAEAVKQHAEQDAANMEAINQSLKNFVNNTNLEEFAAYVHKRNHDMLDAMNRQSLSMELVAKRLEALQKLSLTVENKA